MLIKFEEEFDENFVREDGLLNISKYDAVELKSLITFLLQKQEEETRKQVYKELQDEGKI